MTIIIPSLNAAHFLPRLLAGLRGFEVIVIDGGSDDASVELAETAGAETMIARAGRGHQMALGAGESDKAWLFFLHADSRLAAGWKQEVSSFIASKRKPAAVFRFALDDPRWRARVLEFFVWLRCLIFVLPYGDQGLLIRRDAYESAGGFADIEIMEDVRLIKNLSRREIHFFKSKLTTSADRFCRRGYVRRVMRNIICLGAYFIGMAPDRIARLYRA